MAKSNTLKLAHGRPCPFCRREMNLSDHHRQPTRDHHPVPKSKGGARTIICCMLCNNRKGDMTAAEWEAYMAETPGWWLLTKRERRDKRAAKREAERTEKWGPRGARVIRQAETPSTPMKEALEQMIGRPSRQQSSPAEPAVADKASDDSASVQS